MRLLFADRLVVNRKRAVYVVDFVVTRYVHSAEATAAADEEYAREVEKAEAECAKLIENNEKRAKELAAALLGRVKDGDL